LIDTRALASTLPHTPALSSFPPSQNPPKPSPQNRSGFCRHQVPGFGPWHRAYLRQFELALIDAARIAASNFQSATLRRQYEQMAEAIRLPFWDWTNPEVPNLLTARSATVLDFETGQPTTTRNPFGFYEYVGAAGDGRNTGRRIMRGSTWAQTMSRSSRRFGMEMASFLRRYDDAAAWVIDACVPCTADMHVFYGDLGTDNCSAHC
jgi:hypothetical protein